MKSKIKVLYIPSWFPDKNNPKHGIYFKEQSELINKYCNLNILNIERIPLKDIKGLIKFLFSNKKPKITGNILSYKYFDYTFKSLIKRTNLYREKVLKFFEIYKNTFGLPDVIHAQVTYPAGYAALVIGNKYNIPFVVTEHSSSFESYFKLFHVIYKTILNKADYYTSVSNFVKNKITKHRSQCEVLPNFIDEKKFSKPTSNFISSYKNKFNIVNISDVEKLKGIDLLLHAINILVYQYKINNIFLHILGDGIDMHEFKSLSEKLKVNNFVRFHGLVKYTDIPGYLKNANALVIASRVETFGIVGIEAMLCGIPVVAADCGGPKDYIRVFNGILSKNEDPFDLAKKMHYIITEYKRFDKKEIIDFTKKNFTGKIIASRIVRIYEKVIYDYKKQRQV